MLRRLSFILTFSLLQTAIIGCAEGPRNSYLPNRPSISCPEEKFIEFKESTITAGYTFPSGCYRIKFDVTVSGGVFKIFPNTIVQFSAGTGITVTGNGSLDATGTASDSILFTGQVNQAGYWDGIRFHHPTTQNNSVKYTIIENAGGEIYSSPSIASAVIIAGKNDAHPGGSQPSTALPGIVTFTNNVVTGSAGYGVFIGLDSPLTTFNSNRFEFSNTAPIAIYARSIRLLDKSNQFVSVTNQATTVNPLPNAQTTTVDSKRIVLLESDIGDIAAPGTTIIPPTTIIPYFENMSYFVTKLGRQTGQPNINILAPVDIEPGVRMVFDTGGFLMISTDTAAFRAIGLPNRKIYFSGLDNGVSKPGAWRGIEFRNAGNPSNTLDYVEIENGGYNLDFPSEVRANFTLTAVNPSKILTRVKVTNSTFQQSLGYGVILGEMTEVPVFKSNTLTKNTLGPIRATPHNIQTLDFFNNFSANIDARDYITLTADEISINESVTFQELTVPYLIRSQPNATDFNVYGSLIIKEGVTLKFADGKGLRIVGEKSSLVAKGTAQKRITFTSLTQGRPGDWLGLQLRNSTNAGNIIEYATIENGGAYTSPNPVEIGNIALLGTASMKLVNVEVRNSQSFGIWKDASATLDNVGYTFANNPLRDNILP